MRNNNYLIKNKIVHPFFLNDPKEEKSDYANKQIMVRHIKSSDYTAEGSEFLDDAIRTKEQPLMLPEESISAGKTQGTFIAFSHFK